MASSVTTTSTSNWSNSHSETSAALNAALRDEILSGLKGYMTDKEIAAFADNLLRPVLNAGLEAAQQEYDAARLGYDQEIENLAVQLSNSIDQQRQTYQQNRAGLETAALQRGMGRSSYLLDSQAALSTALSDTIRRMTDENTRQTAQVESKATLAAKQNAQTQGRLKTDYASQLAAKVQELKEGQRQEYNQNYMSATSAAMGSVTNANSTGGSYSVSSTFSGGGGGGGGKKSDTTVDATVYGGGGGSKHHAEALR